MEQWKKGQAVLLPHNSTNTAITKYLPNTLSLNNDILAPHTNQLLLIVVESKIEVGDVYLILLEGGSYSIHQFNNNVPTSVSSAQYYKKLVAASSDILVNKSGISGAIASWEFISIAKPSEYFTKLFIESFNKGIVIGDILVEYTLVLKSLPDSETGQPEDCIRVLIEEIKIDPKNNTINIKG